MESDSQVFSGQAVVTRRLVSLPGGHSVVFLWPTQAETEVESCWRKHLMRVCIVLYKSSSISIPHFIHDDDTDFLFEISTAKIFRVLSFTPQGINWCRCVGPRWKKRNVNSSVLLWPIGSSGTVPYDFINPGFIMCFVCSELDEVLNKLTEGPSEHQEHVSDATETSGEHTDVDQRRSWVRSIRTFKMETS